SSRFSAAFFGTALVLMPVLLRPWLGRVGALATALFLAISPSLLYYSRFIRDDPYVVFFTLGLIVCILQYRRSERDRWLYAAALLLSLSFCSMEISYYITLDLLLFLEGLLAADLSGRIAEQRGWDARRRVQAFLVLLPIAWLAALFWPLVEEKRARWHLDELPASGVLLLVLGLLAAPQYSAALTRLPWKGINFDLNAPVRYVMLWGHVTRLQAVGWVVVLTLLGLSFLFGLNWNRRRWLILAACFYIPYVLLYTTFFTNTRGFASGIWGALSYWLDQQSVNRGNQPVYYYAMTQPTYEYLTMALAAFGLVVYALRRGLENTALLFVAVVLLPFIAVVNNAWGNTPTLPVAALALLCATAAMSGSAARQLLIFYYGAIFWELSFSGEKMPWLTMHLALPLAVLAGFGVQEAFGTMPRLLPALRRYAWAASGAVLVAGALLAGALASRSVGGALKLGLAALFLVLAAGALLALFRLRTRQGDSAADRLPRWAPFGMVTVAAAAGFLGVLTLRVDYWMNWVHPDTPDEMLIYTQTSPDIPKVMKQIDEYAAESGMGHNLPIIVDSNDAFTWPWAWYLRNYPRTTFPDPSLLQSEIASGNVQPGSVLLLNAADAQIAGELPGFFGPGERFHHRWWFPEDGYRTTTEPRFFSRVANGSELRRWWTFITNRDGITIPPSDVSPSGSSPIPSVALPGTGGGDTQAIGSVDAIAYFPANWVPGKGLLSGAQAAQAQQPAPPVRTSGSTLIIGSPSAGAGGLQAPAGVAADSAGNIYEVDMAGGRVRKFDGSGQQLAATDPADPNLRFNQPWGIAVDRDGYVYIADTWNHRIVKLDSSLRFVTAWGTFGRGDPSPLKLYGPRGVAVDAQGNLWVTDTGNERVIEYDPNGKPLGTFGGPGSNQGEFNEPVGIAIGGDGTIYVADTWNNRIEYFDANFAFKGMFSVNAWTDPTGGGTDQNNKPYLAVLPDNTLLATFPDAAHVVHFDTQGNVLASVAVLPGLDTPLRRPIDVATAPDGAILVSDSV
ncbi:MAG TPA: SMP-30/gluconolactonase/LRE family protein, partial [Dehalococcoidia bacterium]|nr:SMP-30/gluconolactonase/LRE family protein [Dehalococcoidia bacterium]